MNQDIDGNDVELSKYRGKVLLIVNVASAWYISLSIAHLRYFVYYESLIWVYLCKIGMYFLLVLVHF